MSVNGTYVEQLQICAIYPGLDIVNFDIQVSSTYKLWNKYDKSKDAYKIINFQISVSRLLLV